jgi:CxxC motif-containing protein (DUF1111 family)
MGLIEAVAEDTIMDMADPEDADGGGISGSVRIVTDPETGDQRPGRFIYKGGKGRLRRQIAGALNTDMGVTTPVFPFQDGGSTARRPRAHHRGGHPLAQRRGRSREEKTFRTMPAADREALIKFLKSL